MCKIIVKSYLLRLAKIISVSYESARFVSKINLIVNFVSLTFNDRLGLWYSFQNVSINIFVVYAI